MYLNPRIIALYDEYTHAPLARRVFLQRLARLAGGAGARAWSRTMAFLKDALR